MLDQLPPTPQQHKGVPRQSAHPPDPFRGKPFAAREVWAGVGVVLQQLVQVKGIWNPG